MTRPPFVSDQTLWAEVEAHMMPAVRELIVAADRQADELRLLHQIRRALEADIEHDVLVRRIVDEVAAVFGYTHVSLYLLENGKELVLQHQVGYDTVLERVPVTRGVVGRVIRSEQPVLLVDTSTDPEFLAAMTGITSEVCVPFMRTGQIAGVLNVESTGGRQLGPDDLRMMIEVSGFLSLALERYELREAVRRSEERLKIALDAAEMGTWRWNPITGDIHWSEQMPAIYGLPAGTPAPNMRAWYDLLHPDDREAVQRVDVRLNRPGDDYEAEFRIVLPSGAHRWLAARGRIIERDVDGRATLVVGITMDVTGRKRLEEERLRLVHVEAARAEAEASQAQLSATLERLTDSFLAVDGEWRLTFANSKALDLLGLRLDQVRDRSLWTALPSLIGTRFERMVRKAAKTQKPTTFDFPLQAKDRWLEVHAYPATNGLSIYLSDVSLRRQADEERRRTEARFRSLVRNASDIILILERDGTVSYASPAVERVIGYSPDEIVGSDNYFRVHPADAKRLRRAFVRVARSSGVSQPIVLRFQHRHGFYRWLEITATNLADDPAIRGIIANCRDVTERHEAEFNLWLLAEASAMLSTSLDVQTTLVSLARLVVAHLSDLCVVDTVDDVGRPERVAVAHRDSHLEARLATFRHDFPLDPSSAFGPGLALRSSRSLIYEDVDAELSRLDGLAERLLREMRIIGLRSAIVVPLIAHGATLGVLSIASSTAGRHTHADLGLIEELARRAALALDNARLYAAAHAAVAARDQFLSVAAHELRTPITAITGFATLLQREMSARNDPVRVDRYVGRLTDASGRLAGLVDDMLDVSRIRSGQLPLRIDNVHLSDLVARVVARYDDEAIGERHRIVVRDRIAPGAVEGDADRLEQVLANLIDNALKYSPAGGIVTVDLCAEADGYLVSVADEGIGVPEGAEESIFSAFGRATNAASSNLPGLGIGLYICRNIIDRHGGRIWATSGGARPGATISFWLPICADCARVT